MAAPPTPTSPACRESIRFRRSLNRPDQAWVKQSASAPEGSARQSRRVRARLRRSSVLLQCARPCVYVSLPLHLSCLQLRESECANGGTSRGHDDAREGPSGDGVPSEKQSHP